MPVLKPVALAMPTEMSLAGTITIDKNRRWGLFVKTVIDVSVQYRSNTDVDVSRIYLASERARTQHAQTR